MEILFKDIRYGFRGLLKRKGFAAIAVLTLALGIGANTAIFTLVNAVMLKSLPVEKPEELVLFSDTASEGTSIEDSPQTGVWQRFSYASYEYFRDHNQSFQDIAAFRSGESRLSVRRTDQQCGRTRVGSPRQRQLFFNARRARYAWTRIDARRRQTRRCARRCALSSILGTATRQ
jgi:hypothetical protein